MSGPNGSETVETSGGPAALAIEERKNSKGETAVLLFIGDTYAVLEPEQAVSIGALMTQYGYHAKTGQDVDGKKVMSEQIRNKLFQRTSLVIKNMQDRNKEPMHIAKEVVDIVLAEVL